MKDQCNDATLEDLIFEALRKARSFIVALNGATFAIDARDSAFVSRCLSSLEHGRILEDDAKGAIDAFRGILCREISKETFETKRVFDGYHDPDLGDVGSVMEVPVRTARGDDLAALLACLDSLVLARDAALDRLRAEQEVRKRI